MTGPPEPTGFAGVAETHCAVVFFVGDRAYKLKKPVDLGFLDFRSLRSRREVCLREVELNRRLAADVYLGVAEVRGPDHAVCDYLVVMRRMPSARRLSTLVRAGTDVTAPVRALARQLAAFHSTARHDAGTAAEGTRDAVRARWQASFDQTRPHRGGVLDATHTAEVERLAMRYLAGREALFASRIADGLVRDGHGDLLADDIFVLPDGPRVLDCLEFDDRLRYVDGLDDAAFLAMDLERLGSPGLARSFLDWYVEFAGSPRVGSLEHHYVAYRAFVRAKVACLRADQGDPDAAGDAREHVTIAANHLREGAVRLILIGGLPGTGKSTVGGALADRLGAVLLRSDRVRKELAGIDPSTPAPASYRAGLYRPEATVATYATLLDHAARLLGRGESVVLDASWSDANRRRDAVAVAEATTADMIELRCTAPPELATDRLRSRAGSADPSDADARIAARMQAHFDPWASAVVLDTSGSKDQSLAAALAATGAMW